MKIDEPNVVAMTLEEEDLTILKNAFTLLEELVGYMADNGFATVAQREGTKYTNQFDFTELQDTASILYSLTETPPNVIL